MRTRWIKGSKGRSTLQPKSLMPALQKALLRVRRLHQGNLEAGSGFVLMACLRRCHTLDTGKVPKALRRGLTEARGKQTGPLEGGQDIRTIQELLCYKKDAKTTVIYTHVRNREPLNEVSPLLTDRSAASHFGGKYVYSVRSGHELLMKTRATLPSKIGNTFGRPLRCSQKPCIKRCEGSAAMRRAFVEKALIQGLGAPRRDSVLSGRGLRSADGRHSPGSLSTGSAFRTGKQSQRKRVTSIKLYKRLLSLGLDAVCFTRDSTCSEPMDRDIERQENAGFL